MLPVGASEEDGDGPQEQGPGAGPAGQPGDGPGAVQPGPGQPDQLAQGPQPGQHPAQGPGVREERGVNEPKLSGAGKPRTGKTSTLDKIIREWLEAGRRVEAAGDVKADPELARLLASKRA